MSAATLADQGQYVRVVLASTTARGGIDLVAVERAVNGERLPLWPAEQVYAARLLAGRAWDFSWIAKRLGVDYNTVVEWRDNGWKA